MKVSFGWVAFIFLFFAVGMLGFLYKALQENMARVQYPLPQKELKAPRSDSDAKRLYINQCASCHGGTGEGLPGAGISLLNGAFSDPELVRIIEEGRPMSGMPAFRHRFQSEDIDALVRYIRYLQSQ